MPKSNVVKSYKQSYPWAANPIKLREAITDLESAKRLDPSVEITEAIIKERYLLRKGALAELATAEKEPEVSKE